MRISQTQRRASGDSGAVIDRGPVDGPARPSADHATETNVRRATHEFVLLAACDRP